MPLVRWRRKTMIEKIIEVFENVSDLLLDLTTREARYITRAAQQVISRVPQHNI